jgi:hypothetical protein
MILRYDWSIPKAGATLLRPAASLAAKPVTVRYSIASVTLAETQLLALRRLLVMRHRSGGLFATERKAARWGPALPDLDALANGTSQF